MSEKKKPTTKIEIFQIIVGVFVSIATAFIGYKTFQLNETSNANTNQLKEIEQRVAEDRLGFERIRDIYDRVEKYISNGDQNESRGAALVILISSLPLTEEENKNKLLALISIGVNKGIVRESAAEIFYESKPVETSSTGKGEFFGAPKIQRDNEAWTVLEQFGYKDSKGVEWTVPVGTVLSGSSVPRFAWSFVGEPFSGIQLSSLAIHEYYAGTRERPVNELNSIFYESLLAAGVPAPTAKIYYAAVNGFGPKW